MEKNLWDKYKIGDESATIIKEAIAELSNVVGSTMGPFGNTVIIPDKSEYGKFTVTKDGVSVADAFTTNDIYKNTIIKLARQVARETVKEAGDGTTTSIVLMNAFLNNLQVKYFKEYDVLMKAVLKELDAYAQKINIKDIYDVAMVSANGDETISRNISSVFTSRNSNVTIKLGHTTDDVLTSNKGYFIPEGLFEDQSKLFKSGLKVTNRIPVLVLTQDLTTAILHKIQPFLMLCKTQHGGEGLIIAPNLDRNVLNTFTSNNLSIVVVKTPGFADHRINLATDIANYCGGTPLGLFDDRPVGVINIGYVTGLTISGTETTLMSDDNKIREKAISDIEEMLTSKKIDDYTRELLEQRLGRLHGDYSTIHVGGHSEAEQKERYDRYEDSVLAIKCALEEGVIEGGGVTLKHLADNLENVNRPEYHIPEAEASKHLVKVLNTPYLKLSNNETHYTHTTLSSKIIDPVKVTKTALIRAYNFAKLMLTTGSIILGNYEE